MIRTTTRLAGFVVLAGIGILSTPALAQLGQIGPAGQRALDNSRAGAVAFRAPGNLVSAGVARLQTATALAQAPITITATGPQFSARAQLLAESIRIVFEQLNQAFTLFNNLLLARAGRTPQLPTASP